MSGPNSDQPITLTYQEQCILHAVAALHRNRDPGNACRFCGVTNCEPSHQAVATLRAAGIGPLEDWAIDAGYAVGPSES